MSSRPCADAHRRRNVLAPDGKKATERLAILRQAAQACAIICYMAGAEGASMRTRTPLRASGVIQGPGHAV